MGHWSQFDLCRQFAEETVRLKRIVQVGNQGNSSPAWGEGGRDLVQKGTIGHLQHIQAGYYRRGDWGRGCRFRIPTQNPVPDFGPGCLPAGDAPKVPFTVSSAFSVGANDLDYAAVLARTYSRMCSLRFVSALGVNYPSLAVASGRDLQIHDSRSRGAGHLQHVRRLSGKGVRCAGLHAGERLCNRTSYSWR